MNDIPDNKPSGLVRTDRLAALAGRVGPSIQALRARPGAVLLLVLLVLAALTAAASQWALGVVVHTRSEVVVPDLSGKSIDQALDALTPLGLSLMKDGVEFDENLPAGAVLRQAPPAGLKVREGRAVRITLSSGGQVAFVPELVGKSLGEAQNLLRAAGMAPGALSQVHSQAHPAGQVMEQSPAAGGTGGRGQLVDMRVSKGPPPEGVLLAPDFNGKHISLVRQWAEDSKVKLDVVRESAEGPPETVLRQAPAADSPVEAGGTLTVAVVAGKSAGGASKWVRYQVPQGARAKVKIAVRDDGGETVVFDAAQEPGSLVEVPVAPQGIARVRIYLAGVLVEERVIE